jgi:hypothetical protein
MERRKRFRPEPDPNPWDDGTLVDAATLQRNALKRVADEMESRNRKAFRSGRSLP